MGRCRIYSFVTFAIGASIPLASLPDLTSGQAAFVGGHRARRSRRCSSIGAAVSLVTGRSMIFSGIRQVVIGAAAAAVTYAVGKVIGATWR